MEALVQAADESQRESSPEQNAQQKKVKSIRRFKARCSSYTRTQSGAKQKVFGNIVQFVEGNSKQKGSLITVTSDTWAAVKF